MGWLKFVLFQLLLAIILNPRMDGVPETPTLKVPDGTQIDSLVVAKEATCVVSAVLNTLSRFLDYRRLWVITPGEECTKLESLVDSKKLRLTCIDEDKVFKSGIKKADIRKWFDKNYAKHGGDVDGYGFGNHTLQGWYFQQFLKLGFILNNDEVLDHLLVWDSDMLMTKRMKFFDHGKTLFMEADAHSIGLYQKTYKKLTGYARLTHSPSGKSYVSHHMMFYRQYVKELLDQFSANNFTNVTGPDRWIYNVLHAACYKIPEGFCKTGFSEYDSYTAWVKKRHKEAFQHTDCTFERSNRFYCFDCPGDDYVANVSEKTEMIGYEQRRLYKNFKATRKKTQCA